MHGLVSCAALLTARLALAMLAAPLLVSWLSHSTGPLGTIAHFRGFGARPTWSLATLAALIAAVTAVARFAQTGLAKWNAMGQATATARQAPTVGKTTPAPPAKPGLLVQLADWLRQKLLPWLGSAIVILIGAILALLWIGDGAWAGCSTGQLVPVLAALVVMLLTRVAANVNRLSMGGRMLSSRFLPRQGQDLAWVAQTTGDLMELYDHLLRLQLAADTADKAVRPLTESELKTLVTTEPTRWAHPSRTSARTPSGKVLGSQILSSTDHSTTRELVCSGPGIRRIIVI